MPSALKLRSYELIRGLRSAGCDLTVVALGAGGRHPRGRAVEDTHIVGGGGFSQFVDACGVFVRAEPLQMTLSAGREADKAIAAIMGRQRPDVIVAFHVRAARAAIRAAGVARARGWNVPTVLDAGDCCTRLWRGAARHGHSPVFRSVARLEHRLLARFEASVVGSFDAVVAASAADARLLRHLTGGRADPVVVPNGVHPTGQAATGPDIMFSGVLDYHPNVAAAIRLIDRIMPTVWCRHPEIRLRLVGADPVTAVRRRSRVDGVDLRADVADVHAEAAGAGVFAAPLSYGAGTQFKLLEAAARGQAIVTTPAAARSLNWRHERQAWIARTDQEFADAIVRLVATPDMRDGLSRRARLHVRATHTWTDAVARWNDLCFSMIRD